MYKCTYSNEIKLIRVRSYYIQIEYIELNRSSRSTPEQRRIVTEVRRSNNYFILCSFFLTCCKRDEMRTRRHQHRGLEIGGKKVEDLVENTTELGEAAKLTASKTAYYLSILIEHMYTNAAIGEHNIQSGKVRGWRIYYS